MYTYELTLAGYRFKIVKYLPNFYCCGICPNFQFDFQTFKISLPIFQDLSKVSVYWYSFNTSSIHVLIYTYELGISHFQMLQLSDSNFSNILKFFMIVASLQFFNSISKLSRLAFQFFKISPNCQSIGNPFIHIVSCFYFQLGIGY